MAAASELISEEKNVDSLSEVFEKGFQLCNNIQNASISMNSKEFQEDVLKAISYLERATVMVNELSIFSTNEDFDEISTADIKYFLLPALLGSLVTKVTSQERSDVLNSAEVYFVDYLQRLKSYSVHNNKIPTNTVTESEEVCTDIVAMTQQRVREQLPTIESLERMASERRNKIERFNEQKELKAKEELLRKRMEKEELDEESTREYYKTLLNSWIINSLEELESIQREKPILAYIAKSKASGKDLKKSDNSPIRKCFKPIIIARNEMQKRVIGVGYPSRPVLTVDEFYAQRYPEQANKNQAPPEDPNLPFGLSMQSMAEDPDRTKKEIEAENAEKEVLEDKEDKVHMIRERNWDDWKDDHRRGWGNRHNMG